MGEGMSLESLKVSLDGGLIRVLSSWAAGRGLQGLRRSPPSASLLCTQWVNSTV